MPAHRIPGRLSLVRRVRRLTAECHDLTCKVVAQARELDEQGIELAAANTRQREARADAKRARAEAAATARLLTAARAELANRDAVTVAAWVRPTDDTDRPTQPIPLQQRGPHAA